MSTIFKHRKTLALVLGLFAAVVATSALVGYWASAARAGGIPTTDPLFYSGLLTDKTGVALSGKKAVAIDLYDAATGGSKKCTTAAKSVTLVQGRFRVALDKACVEAVHDNADLWVEVIVDGTSMGRSKIGAVPYAVEAQRVAEQRCPPGYILDTSATNIALCKRGKDEMVKVGDFWVDRYEMTIVDSTTYKDGKCDGAGKRYGMSSDDYPKTFPDSGNYTTNAYACSKSGVIPSSRMTWFQASVACGLAKKHLCTNGEWQLAALGTPDKQPSCNITGGLPQKTGSLSACNSHHGSHDMVGNLIEWVDWWGQAGNTWMKSDGQSTQPWPAGYGDGKDIVYNMNGKTLLGGWVNGLPAAMRRGGDSNGDTKAGVYSVDLDGPPAGYGTTTGARCCRR